MTVILGLVSMLSRTVVTSRPSFFCVCQCLKHTKESRGWLSEEWSLLYERSGSPYFIYFKGSQLSDFLIHQNSLTTVCVHSTFIARDKKYKINKILSLTVVLFETPSCWIY